MKPNATQFSNLTAQLADCLVAGMEVELAVYLAELVGWRAAAIDAAIDYVLAIEAAEVEAARAAANALEDLPPLA